MSNYIGNQPSAGEFKRLDSIASSFDGSTTQFNLNYNTVSQPVGDSSQLIVSLNGIVQEPLESYTLGIGGSSIIFSIAPTAGDTCHIVLLGGVGNTVTPADGSVTASKLDASLKDYLEETFVADGIQTDFTLTRAVVGINNLLVTIDGIVQPSSAFTATGTTLTISEVLAANTDVRVVHMGVKAGVYVPANDSITADMLANSINDDIAAGVAALPLAGGTMTGVIGNFESTGIDDQATSTSVTILSDGKVGIGTSSPSDKVEILNGALMLKASSASGYPNLKFQNGSKRYDVQIDGSTQAFRIVDNTASSTRMVIDSSGNVGIGTTSNLSNNLGTLLNVNNGNIIGNGTGGSYFTYNARYDNSWLRNETSGVGIISLTNSGKLTYRTAVSGNAGTEPSLTEIIRTGDVDPAYVTFDGASQVRLTLGNEGTPGTNTANWIRGNAGYLQYNSASSGHTWEIGGAEKMRLLATGGLTFNGETTDSNALDDYEEGTWIPTDASGQGITGFTLSHNQYTKIGRKVFAHCQITFPSSSNTTLARLSLPFSPNASSNNSATGGVCQEQNIGSGITVTAAVNYTNGVIFRPNGYGNYNYAQLSGKTLRFAIHYNAT